jgi:hypothetical protein
MLGAEPAIRTPLEGSFEVVGLGDEAHAFA